MRRLALLVALLVPPAAIAQEEVVSGLSNDSVSITANFDGSDILIYGAVKREQPIPATGLDVIITVEGPSEAVMVRRKSREAGIWVNTASVEIDRAPSFYAVETTGPLEKILYQTEDLRHSISPRQIIRSVGAPSDISDSAAFTDALIRLREKDGLYAVHEGAVTLKAETLFSTRIDLPANLIEGAYRTRIFLTRDRSVIAGDETVIDVRKVGLERWLYDLAQNQATLYALLALVLASIAGWAASAIFRLIRN